MKKKKGCVSVITIRLVIKVFNSNFPKSSHTIFSLDPPPRAIYFLRAIPPPYLWPIFFLRFSTAVVMTKRLERSICDQKCVLYPSSPCKTFLFRTLSRTQTLSQGLLELFSTFVKLKWVQKKIPLECIEDNLDKESAREALRVLRPREKIAWRATRTSVWDKREIPSFQFHALNLGNE